MKALIFSDLHAHPHRFGASIDPESERHSRLQHALDVLWATHADCIDNKVSARFFIGDMFHVRGSLAPSVLNPVIDHYKHARPDSGYNYRDFGVVGNHDMENRQTGEHALTAIPDLDVLEDHGYKVVSLGEGTLGVGWVAYEPDIKTLKAKVEAVAAQCRTSAIAKPDATAFFLHHGVDGAMAGIPDMGFGVADLPHGNFDFMFCGDYHTHKELIPGRAWMVGAPLQQNFGDVDQKRGWMVVDFTTKEVEFIENINAPLFIDFDATKRATKKLLSGNFVRVRSDDEKELKELHDKALAQGALAVQTELVRDWEAIKRSDVTLTMTNEQLFDTWLAEQSLGDLSESLLKRLNKAALAEAGVT